MGENSITTEVILLVDSGQIAAATKLILDLEAENRKLRNAVERFGEPECRNLRHRTGEFHNDDEPCPVEALIKNTLAGGGFG